jgi:hypothetical protein
MKSMRRYRLAAIAQGALLVIAASAVRAEDPPAEGYVTRKEYEELKAQMLAMKKELDALKKERAPFPSKKRPKPTLLRPHAES